MYGYDAISISRPGCVPSKTVSQQTRLINVQKMTQENKILKILIFIFICHESFDQYCEWYIGQSNNM